MKIIPFFLIFVYFYFHRKKTIITRKIQKFRKKINKMVHPEEDFQMTDDVSSYFLELCF